MTAFFEPRLTATTEREILYACLSRVMYVLDLTNIGILPVRYRRLNSLAILCDWRAQKFARTSVKDRVIYRHQYWFTAFLSRYRLTDLRHEGSQPFGFIDDSFQCLNLLILWSISSLWMIEALRQQAYYSRRNLVREGVGGGSVSSGRLTASLFVGETDACMCSFSRTSGRTPMLPDLLVKVLWDEWM